MNRKKLLISLAMAMLSMAGLAADNLPALRVEGRNLVDANGKIVVLHGVMDTPNRYFNGWRWQQWKPDYSEADIKPCLEYFSKQFSAITDKKQGAYCTVFRLHMDPCWTNDPAKKVENEADISAFNMARYRLYLQKLYIPLIKDAIAHGLYVIVRPPGVCPQDISVGDKYNRYLKGIWKTFAVDEYIRQNSGIISIELANEPVRFIWVMALIRIKHCMITSSRWLMRFASRGSRESSGFRAQVIRASIRITSRILSPIARTTSLMQYMFIPDGMEI